MHARLPGTLNGLAFCALLLPAALAAHAEGQPGMDPLPMAIPKDASYRFEGYVGQRVDANIAHWLLSAPVANPGMLEMFRMRDRDPKPELVPWAGEFAGKYLISAVLAQRMSDDPRLDALLRDFVAELVSTQAEDGYLGPFRKEERLLGHWDLWGHYHVMLGLIMWYEDTGDQAAFDCAVRAADLICATYLDTDRRPIDAGSDEMNLSVVHVMGRLHRHTQDARYLRLMEIIIEDWETPPAGDYFRLALDGVPFYKTPKPRWESIHAIQGLVELYRITGKVEYRRAYETMWRSIQALDVHNTGAFSTNEQAVGNPYAHGAIETCCHVAWTYMSEDMLLLTGDSTVADELEHGFWNAILGYQHPSGRWSTYNTPSNGKRPASAHTIVFQARPGTPELNCCSVNAPRGLGMLSEWALLSDAKGNLVVNYYGPMHAELKLADGTALSVIQQTRYPADGKVRIELGMEKAHRFDVKLRIPRWSKQTSVSVNGEATAGASPGEYLSLTRVWEPGARIELELDMGLRNWVGDADEAGKVSLYYGPLLLAFDQKFNDYDCADMAPLDFGKLDIVPVDVPDMRFPPLVLFDVKTSDGRVARLCDFASAGAYGTEYATWLPVVNAPPAPFHLIAPEDQAAVPAGPMRFAWSGPRHAQDKTYRLRIYEAADLGGKRVFESEALSSAATVLRSTLEAGRSYDWQVAAENAHGHSEAVGGPWRFSVDASLPNPYAEYPALLGPREDGLVTGCALDGDGTPAYGYLDDAEHVTPAKDRHGRENGAVRFNAKGRLRYQVGRFPAQDYTLLIWACPEGEGRPGLAQICSAWARGSDDPLRLVIDKGQLFARIEGGGNAGTSGVALPQDKWSHIALVKNGPRLILYVNGVRQAESPAPADLSTSAAESFALGANPHYSGDEYLRGCLDDFALYDRPFTGEDIAQIYEEGLRLE